MAWWTRVTGLVAILLLWDLGLIALIHFCSQLWPLRQVYGCVFFNGQDHCD